MDARSGRNGLFFLFVIVIFMAVTSTARANSSGNTGSSLGLWSSMGNDPDAIECLRVACESSTSLSPSVTVDESGEIVVKGARSSFENRVEQCKSAHFARVKNAFVKTSGTAIRGFALDEDAISAFDIFKSCKALSVPTFGNLDKAAYTTALAKVENRRADLRTTKSVRAKATGDNDDDMMVLGPVPTPTKKPTVVAKTEAKVEAKPAQKLASPIPMHAAAPTAASAPTPVPGSFACTIPDNMEFVAAVEGGVELYISPGAYYGQILASSCWTSHFDTDPKSVIELNVIERTIPFCDRDGGGREFDPQRTDAKLVGTVHFTLGDPANKLFLANCQANDGIIGLALQAKQKLFLAYRETVVSPPADRRTPPAQPPADQEGRVYPQDDSPETAVAMTVNSMQNVGIEQTDGGLPTNGQYHEQVQRQARLVTHVAKSLGSQLSDQEASHEGSDMVRATSPPPNQGLV